MKKSFFPKGRRIFSIYRETGGDTGKDSFQCLLMKSILKIRTPVGVTWFYGQTFKNPWTFDWRRHRKNSFLCQLCKEEIWEFYLKLSHKYLFQELNGELNSRLGGSTLGGLARVWISYVGKPPARIYETGFRISCQNILKSSFRRQF